MSELFLGRLAYEPRPYVRVDPVAHHEDGRWKTYDDWKEALPSEGKVFAPSLMGFVKDELLTFGLELNSRPDRGPDKYVLGKYDRVREVLDFRSIGAEAARNRLIEKGLATLNGARMNIAAAIGEGVCVVLTLSRDPEQGRLIADAINLDRLPTYRFDDRLFEGERIGGRWIEIPGVTIGPPVGQVNWSRDVDFLGTVLKRINRAVPQGTAGLISRAQIPGLVTYLSKAALLPSAAGDLAPMLERAKRLLTEVIANSKALNDLVATITAFEPVEQRLKAEMAARREVLENELRTDLEARIRSDLRHDMGMLYEAREKLEAEVSTLSSTTQRLRDEAVEHETATRTARTAIVEEITAVIRNFGDLPPEGDPTVEALAVRLGGILENGRSSISELARPGSPWAIPQFKRGQSAHWDTIGACFKATAERHGYDLEDMVLADTGARAGDVVVLPEEHSAFVAAYAEGIAGGNLTRHVLDPSVLNVDDLWTRPGSDRSTAFSKAWAAARLDNTSFHVLLLDGLQRTPLDLWIPSLIDVLDSKLRPSNLLVFATLSRTFVDEGRIWKRLDRSVTAVDPVLTASSSSLLGEVIGRKFQGHSFDPASAPLPPKEACLDVVDRAEALESHRGRLRFLRLYRSAWPHVSLLDPVERAWSIAYPEHAAKTHERTAAGFAWLRSMLENKS
jgi:hypothetical protein